VPAKFTSPRPPANRFPFVHVWLYVVSCGTGFARLKWFARVNLASQFFPRQKVWHRFRWNHHSLTGLGLKSNLVYGML